MTGPVIKSVALPTAPRRPDGFSAARRTLPLAAIPTRRTRTIVYGMAIADARGRVADQAILHTLEWLPGRRLNIRETHGLLVIRPDEHGVFSVTSQGHLRLPAVVRHSCGLIPGERVLLAADPTRDLLIVYPPAALDDLLTELHNRLSGGDPT